MQTATKAKAAINRSSAPYTEGSFNSGAPYTEAGDHTEAGDNVEKFEIMPPAGDPDRARCSQIRGKYSKWRPHILYGPYICFAFFFFN